jgi:predicted MFS family arabinose efflux permease
MKKKQPATRSIARIAQAIDEMAIGFALSPLQLLLHFVFVNMLNYVDRGVVAGVLPTLQAEFGLDSTQTGFLGSSFVVSYMVFSLPFAQLSQRFSPFLLMGVGLVCWIGSALVAYFSTSFQLLLVARSSTPNHSLLHVTSNALSDNPS